MANDDANAGNQNADDNANADDAKNAADKGGEAGKKGANGGDKKDENSDKPKPVTFDSQDEVDKMIQKRIDRALKKSKDDAELTDKQRLEKDRDEANLRANLSDAKDSFIVKTGLPYEKALRVFGLVKDKIEFDDKGKATNLAEVIKDARSELPELFPAKVKGKGDGGGGDGKSAAGESIDSWLRKKS